MSTLSWNAPRRRAVYLRVLGWCFVAFSTARILAYLPTVSALQASGDASSHSLWTWATWLGSNVTLAAWLYEQDGQRWNRAALVSVGNAVMCLLIVAQIVGLRW